MGKDAKVIGRDATSLAQLQAALERLDTIAKGSTGEYQPVNLAAAHLPLCRALTALCDAVNNHYRTAISRKTLQRFQDSLHAAALVCLPPVLLSGSYGTRTAALVTCHCLLSVQWITALTASRAVQRSMASALQMLLTEQRDPGAAALFARALGSPAGSLLFATSLVPLAGVVAAALEQLRQGNGGQSDEPWLDLLAAFAGPGGDASMLQDNAMECADVLCPRLQSRKAAQIAATLAFPMPHSWHVLITSRPEHWRRTPFVNAILSCPAHVGSIEKSLLVHPDPSGSDYLETVTHQLTLVAALAPGLPTEQFSDVFALRSVWALQCFRPKENQDAKQLLMQRAFAVALCLYLTQPPYVLGMGDPLPSPWQAALLSHGALEALSWKPEEQRCCALDMNDPRLPFHLTATRLLLSRCPAISKLPPNLMNRISNMATSALGPDPPLRFAEQEAVLLLLAVPHGGVVAQPFPKINHTPVFHELMWCTVATQHGAPVKKTESQIHVDLQVACKKLRQKEPNYKGTLSSCQRDQMFLGCMYLLRTPLFAQCVLASEAGAGAEASNPHGVLPFSAQELSSWLQLFLHGAVKKTMAETALCLVTAARLLSRCGMPTKMGDRLASALLGCDADHVSRPDVAFLLRAAPDAEAHAVYAHSSILRVRCPGLIAQVACKERGRGMMTITLGQSVTLPLLNAMLHYAYAGWCDVPREEGAARALACIASAAGAPTLAYLLRPPRHMLEPGSLPTWVDALPPRSDLVDLLDNVQHTPPHQAAADPTMVQLLCAQTALDEAPVYAHRCVLVATCDYMRAALQFAPQSCNQVHLPPELTPAGALALRHWLYTEDLLALPNTASVPAVVEASCCLASAARQCLLPELESKARDVAMQALNSATTTAADALHALPLAAQAGDAEIASIAAELAARSYPDIRASGILESVDAHWAEQVRRAWIHLAGND